MPPKKKIWYVEDEPFLGKVVKETLEFRNYEVMLQSDGAKAMEGMEEFAPDICVLDVMLPNVDGFTIGKKIKEKFPKLPVIFLTAKNLVEDVVKGFESGGTDYMRKPFSIEELITRIENQVKLHATNTQSLNQTTETIIIGKFTWSPKENVLKHEGKTIHLSHRESEVLNILILNTNEIIDRRKLLKEVWGDDSFFNSRNLDVYIRKLRDYFLVDPTIKIITLKGKGYRFVVGSEI